MGILARGPVAALEQAWERLADKPRYRLLRPPQIGLAMIRGRAGGAGEPFNLGEMTMTRAAVQVARPDGAIATGYGHVAGRAARHAELAAVFDALLQHPARRLELMGSLVEPLAAALEAERRAKRAAVAPSTVAFFTMVRGV